MRFNIGRVPDANQPTINVAAGKRFKYLVGFLYGPAIGVLIAALLTGQFKGDDWRHYVLLPWTLLYFASLLLEYVNQEDHHVTIPVFVLGVVQAFLLYVSAAALGATAAWITNLITKRYGASVEQLRIPAIYLGLGLSLLVQIHMSNVKLIVDYNFLNALCVTGASLFVFLAYTEPPLRTLDCHGLVFAFNIIVLPVLSLLLGVYWLWLFTDWIATPDPASSPKTDL